MKVVFYSLLVILLGMVGCVVWLTTDAQGLVSLDGSYLKMETVEQYSASYRSESIYSSATLSSFGDYIRNERGKTWKLGGRASYAVLEAGYKRLPPELQLEAGLSQTFFEYLKVGFFWRGKWDEEVWIPKDGQDHNYVVFLTEVKRSYPGVITFDFLASNKYITEGSDYDMEWLIRAQANWRAFLGGVEYSWELKKIFVGVRL